MTQSPRTFRLRTALGESQAQFAARLGQSQVTVFRLESGQVETGPQALLLDHIEAQIAAGLIGQAARTDHPSPLSSSSLAAGEPAPASASVGAGAEAGCSTAALSVEHGGA